MKRAWSFINRVTGGVLLICIPLIASAQAGENFTANKPDTVCALDLSQLMKSLARNKEISARFKEEKFLGILDKPLRAEGTLSFRAPDYLEKTTTHPEKERMVMEDETVQIIDAQDSSRTLPLDDHPPLQELLNGFRFTLAGNLNGLERYYQLDLTGHCHQWTLTLIPRSASAMNFIDRIIILGGNDRIEKITWVESNGDFTVMTIEKEKS